MAWVRRGNKDYYYRGRRRGRRVEREYFGNGPEAQLAAALDDQRRQERQARREAFQAETDRWNSGSAALKELIEISNLLVRAALLGAGFHQHERGAWRKRREAARDASERARPHEEATTGQPDPTSPGG